MLRSLFGNGAYVEGWAEYIAQVMMDAGFADNDPRFRLSMRKLRLRLLANAILDVRMHTMGMTDEQAMELMTKQAFQTQAEAEGKLQRAKLSSTQLPDLLRGAAGLAGAAAEVRGEEGPAFDMLAFHDLVLGPGRPALRRAGERRDGAALRQGRLARSLAALLAAAPCAAQSAKQDLLFEKLEAAVTREDRDLDGVLGVAIVDLASGRSLMHNADEVFPVASSIKLAVLAELYPPGRAGRGRDRGQGHPRPTSTRWMPRTSWTTARSWPG